MKNGSKNERILDGKTFQNYALCNEFIDFDRFGKSRKIDAKMATKMVQKSADL